jgi:hypothetical protein
MRILGSCHCGNITFDLTWDPDPETIPARACGCTFCVKHGGVWTSNPEGTLRATVRDPSKVSKYSFGTATAEFHVCSTCGNVPIVTCHIDGGLYAVVNVNAFNNVNASMLRRMPASYDDETTETRLARRKRNWIRDVKIAAA